jgi:hypothetical protein
MNRFGQPYLAAVQSAIVLERSISFRSNGFLVFCYFGVCFGVQIGGFCVNGVDGVLSCLVASLHCFNFSTRIAFCQRDPADFLRFFNLYARDGVLTSKH